MTALFIIAVLLALLVGGMAGFGAAALAQSASRDDECRECRAEHVRAAFADVDSFGGTDSE